MRRLVEALTVMHVRTWSGLFVGCSALAAFALAACTVGETQERTQGTPACENLDHSKTVREQAQEIFECAKFLDTAQAEHAFESGVPGTNDKQWLDDPPNGGGPPNFNCIGSIWPERRAHLNPTANVGPFESGGGRVTAKIELKTGHRDKDCRLYPQGPLNLYPGISYVFFYELRDSLDAQNNKPGRIAVVHEDATLPSGQRIQIRPMKICWHPGQGYEHAFARWSLEPEDAKGWWTCVNGGCCNMP
jgi:hypothetical protein